MYLSSSFIDRKKNNNDFLALVAKVTIGSIQCLLFLTVDSLNRKGKEEIRRTDEKDTAMASFKPGKKTRTRSKA